MKKSELKNLIKEVINDWSSASKTNDAKLAVFLQNLYSKITDTTNIEELDNIRDNFFQDLDKKFKLHRTDKQLINGWFYKKKEELEWLDKD